MNVATPLTALTAAVPERVAPTLPVPLLMASVTNPVKLGSRLLLGSSARTVMLPSEAPETADEGCVPYASLAAAAFVMLKLLDVSPVSPLAPAVSV